MLAYEHYIPPSLQKDTNYLIVYRPNNIRCGVRYFDPKKIKYSYERIL